MKEELKQKIKTEFAYHLYNFDSAIYGCKRPVDDKMKECFKKIIDKKYYAVYSIPIKNTGVRKNGRSVKKRTV